MVLIGGYSYSNPCFHTTLRQWFAGGRSDAVQLLGRWSSCSVRIISQSPSGCWNSRSYGKVPGPGRLAPSQALAAAAAGTTASASQPKALPSRLVVGISTGKSRRNGSTRPHPKATGSDLTQGLQTWGSLAESMQTWELAFWAAAAGGRANLEGGSKPSNANKTGKKTAKSTATPPRITGQEAVVAGVTAEEAAVVGVVAAVQKQGVDRRTGLELPPMRSSVKGIAMGRGTAMPVWGDGRRSTHHRKSSGSRNGQ